METIKKQGLFILLLGSVLLSSCVEHKEEEPLPYIGNHDIVNGDTTYHTTPDWSYLTEDSVRITSKDLADKIWIVDFFYATCPTICSPMTDNMKVLTDSLAGFSNDLAFLSFTIDPENDTPEALKAYRKKHKATAENWYFLTGNEEEDVNEMAFDGFTVFAFEDEQEPGGFAHSSNFVLVDKNRHIRGVYDSLNDEQRSKLIKDVKRLLKR